MIPMFRLFKSNSCIDEVAATTKKRSFFNIAITFLLIYFAGSLAAAIILMVPLYSSLLNDPEIIALMSSNLSEAELTEAINNAMIRIQNEFPAWMSPFSLFATAATIFAVIYFAKRFERRSMFSLGFAKKGFASEYAIGAGIGLLMISLTYGIALISGEVSLVGLNKAAVPEIIFLYFLGFIIQGASEEILLRGYFFVTASAHSNIIVGGVANSLIFALLHITNNGITPLALINIFLFGIFASLYFLRRGSIWGICAVHTVWNFVQGNVFGCSVSGGVIEQTILTTASKGSSAIFSGGSFGLEGGLGTTIVLLGGISVLTFMKNKNIYEFFSRKTKEFIPAY